MPTWEALHAWLTPRDPTGVYRLMLDLMLLFGLRERECRGGKCGQGGVG